VSTHVPELDSIVYAAIEMASPEERAAYVARTCGADAELRRQAERLVAAHFRAGSFLEEPAVPPATPAALRPPSEGAPGLDPAEGGEAPGTRLGPYKLLEQVGEGGMGAVWMAEQQEPVRRRVALKVIKAGMDTRQVVARFEQERQALALMDHPHIAKVFDGGTTAGGRPYFVMELVKGVPITKYCDEQRLTPQQRLELFVPVCQAIQHAHQKGIIHRDVKPSNVLVAPYDGKPVVKVIDFGVAKATGQRLTERTLFTDFGAVVGTLEYMSPEQAELNNQDIDTRSDIYSLGVLLYELLTGTTPLTRERLHQTPFPELLRLIREEELPKPSTRLSSSDTLPAIAAARQTEPAKLTKLVRGDLDWIVMKALDKDCNRRYKTANGLAMDVQRYLRDEPVQACPPSVGYRFRKFARRNKRALVMASVMTVALVLVVAALAGSIGWAARDMVARDRDVVGYLEQAERGERHGDWPQALRAVERAEGRLAGGGPAPLRRRAEQVRERVQFVASLEESRLENSAVRDDHFDSTGADRAYAAAFKNHGWDVQALAAEEMAERIAASPIRMHLVAALDHWASVKEPMDVAGAERLLTIARLADDDDWRRQLRDPAVRKDRAALERLAGREGVLDQPPGSLVLLANILVTRDARSAAVDLLQRAQQRHPDDFWINHDLAFHLAHGKQPRLDEAVGFYRAAVALRPQSPGAHLNLGRALADQGRHKEAEAAYREAIRLNPDYAMAYSNLGGALSDQGRHKEAEAAFREAIALKPDYAMTYSNLGAVLADQGLPWRTATSASPLPTKTGSRRQRRPSARPYASSPTTPKRTTTSAKSLPTKTGSRKQRRRTARPYDSSPTNPARTTTSASPWRTRAGTRRRRRPSARLYASSPTTTWRTTASAKS
jgi:serine/threonine protein kinase/tetratricopeptide (TPR) repeat protein